MVFSIGNLITLIIVLIILAIYRQMDRNNRSLEKIRRYSEKITDELDKFVDGKTVEVKNLAVELEVHQKTGREILKRITGSEEALNERAEGIQRIAQRIDEYDTAIGNLMGLTGKVDESMKRLQEESEFVDRTGKRLKDVQTRLEELEKNLPRLTEEFESLNRSELEGLQQEVYRAAEEQVSRLDDELSRARDEVETFHSRMDQAESGWEEMEKATLERIRRGHESLLDSAETDSTNLKLALEEEFKEVTARIGAYRDKAQGDLEAMEGGFARKLASFHERAGSLEEAFLESMKLAAERGRSLEDEIFVELKAYIQNQARGLEKDMAVLMNQERERVSKNAEEVKILMGETGARVTEWQTVIDKRLEDEIDRLDSRFAGHQEEVLRKLEELTDTAATGQESRRQELEALIEKTGETLKEMQSGAAGTLKGMEDRLQNYEEEFNYRLSRMENLGSEIRDVDENLRKSMEAVISSINSDFHKSREAVLAHIEAENLGIKGRVETLVVNMGSLEKELDVLKSRAYDNVSEKLQVFEDEFFRDLKEREETIRKQLEDWKEGLDRDLEQLSDEASARRESLSKELGDQLKDRLTALQTKTFQQYEKYEEQVTHYQERINERIGLTERSLEGLEDSLKKEIGDIRQNSQVEFEKVFTEYRTANDALLKKWEREWDLAHKTQEEKMDTGFRQLTTEMEASQSEVTLWQNRVQQQMNEVEIQLSEKYAGLKAEASETVTGINKDFLEQRNEFDAFFLDLQKRSKDLEMEIDSRLKDFRAASQDMKDKVEGMQQRLFGKIEEDYNALMINVQEVDKKQKSFIAQTKIFDRADSLKMALQENIEDLKGEITRITAESREIKEAERKFLAIKKLNDEVSSKLTRFLTEKRRIEEMEGDFKKLINLSQSIDIKLDQVTTSNDHLQEIQIRIRNLEELESEVFQKYERLEKKRDVLDSTADEVDRNFQRVQDLESAMKSVEVELRGIGPQVAEIAGQIKLIVGEKSRTAAAVAQLQNLEEVLSEVETRMEKMQKAREWLAGTETRLEEVHKKAQEQVKLLGSLVREGGTARGTGKTAPMGSRDVVTKLARQGWSSEEIARATQLSRGEVELILELKK